MALGKTKLATVSAYYAIFHATRALLYTKKYREKSHIQLAFAIKAFFIDKGLLPQEYYDNFIQALSFREMADYKRTFSKQGESKTLKPQNKPSNKQKRSYQKNRDPFHCGQKRFRKEAKSIVIK